MKRIFVLIAFAIGLLVTTSTPAVAQPFVFDQTQCYIDGQSWTGQATWSSQGTVSVRLDNGKRYVERPFTYTDGHDGYKTFQWSPSLYGIAPDGWITLTITTQGRPFADIRYGIAGCVQHAPLRKPAHARLTSSRVDEHYRHVYLPTTPCKREDSPGPCFWDAGWQGDGGGHSFWVGAKQCVHYLNPKIRTRCPG